MTPFNTPLESQAPLDEAQAGPPQDIPVPFLAHFKELRERALWVVACFLICFGVLYAFKSHLFAVLARPLMAILVRSGGQFIYTHVAEAFTISLKLCFLGAAALSLPLALVQGWLFIAPALYKREKTVALGISICAPLLFITGVFFCYWCVLPQAWAFFVHVAHQTSVLAVPVQIHARVADYLGLTAQILFAFGLCFQLPLMILVLGHLGLVKSQTLLRGRKYALLGLMILSALLTPPDVLSMLGLTAPLYVLYELAARGLRLLERRRS